ncbi:MAG: DUF4340 domain-containing protein [Clostridia bacterium]|nr:DUF4340 domain-containing protein [Clostridia bacterium]
MREVRRKAGGKSSGRRTLIAAVCIAALACCAAAALLWPRQQEQPKETYEIKAQWGFLENREENEVESLTVKTAGREEWTAVRGEDGVLRLSGEAEWGLDSSIGLAVTEAMTQIGYDYILTENPEEYQNDLAAFGLEEPRLTARVRYTDGTERTVRIGNSFRLEEAEYYYMTVDGDDRLFAVNRDPVSDLETEQELLHPITQPVIHAARIDRITVFGEDGQKQIEWELQGELEDPDAAEQWMLTAPYRYPADGELIENMRKNAENLILSAYAAEDTQEERAKYGLETPRGELRIHMAAAALTTVGTMDSYDIRDWEEETVSFLIGKKKDDMTDYVCFNGAIYTMHSFMLDIFTEAKPLRFLSRYPVSVSMDSLKSLTVENAAETVTYEITREAVENGDETEVRLTCSRNGKEIEAAAFSAAYEAMRTVTVSGKLPDGWVKRETKIKYTFRTLNGRTHTIELSEYDAMHDAVTADGCTQFYLIRNGMGDLPGDQ